MDMSVSQILRHAPSCDLAGDLNPLVDALLQISFAKALYGDFGANMYVCLFICLSGGFRCGIIEAGAKKICEYNVHCRSTLHIDPSIWRRVIGILKRPKSLHAFLSG